MLHDFRNHPQITHAFIIDHALRDESAFEVEQAAAHARALGYEVQIDKWDHAGPTSGIQVKARQYRYKALGDMCRKAGLKHLITAHTADDQAETLLMRLDRQTGWRGLAGMRKSAYGPLWPALAGVTLHRPWLDISRAALRAYNDAQGLAFIDDPSNENRDYSRVRARQALAADQDLRADLLRQQSEALVGLKDERRTQADWMNTHAQIHPHGFLTLDSVPTAELLLHLLNIVAGKGGPIDAAKRARLATSMSGKDFKSGTLSGAWVVKDSHGFVLARDKVAVLGRNAVSEISPITLNAGEERLWDGRFRIRSKADEMLIEPAFGQLQNLRYVAETKEIFDLPAAARPCLPVFRMRGNVIGFGQLETADLVATSMSAQRLQGVFET